MWGVVVRPPKDGLVIVRFEQGDGGRRAVPSGSLRRAPAEMQGPVVLPPRLRPGMEVDVGRGADGRLLASACTGVVKRKNLHDDSFLVEIWDAEHGVEHEIFCWPEAVVESTRLRLRAGQRALA